MIPAAVKRGDADFGAGRAGAQREHGGDGKNLAHGETPNFVTDRRGRDEPLRPLAWSARGRRGRRALCNQAARVIDDDDRDFGQGRPPHFGSGRHFRRSDSAPTFRMALVTAPVVVSDTTGTALVVLASIVIGSVTTRPANAVGSAPLSGAV